MLHADTPQLLPLDSSCKLKQDERGRQSNRVVNWKGRTGHAQQLSKLLILRACTQQLRGLHLECTMAMTHPCLAVRLLIVAHKLPIIVNAPNVVLDLQEMAVIVWPAAALESL